MKCKLTYRAVMLVAIVPIAATIAGCSGPDNPKMAEAPPYVPPANQEPPKIRGQTTEYGQQPKYKEMTDRMEKHYKGR